VKTANGSVRAQRGASVFMGREWMRGGRVMPSYGPGKVGRGMCKMENIEHGEVHESPQRCSR